MATQLAHRSPARDSAHPLAGVAGWAWALAGLTALAAALRFSTLGVQSFWHDEAVTVGRILHPSLIDTLKTIPSSEATPPLYYVLAWGWSKLFGLSEVGLRSLSALFGTAVVPVVYLAAERVASRRAALIAAAFVACSPMLVWYSQEARAYELLVLLCALSLLFFLRGSLLWWAVASALALATHYFAVFFVAPEALWLLWRARRPATWVAVAFVGIAGAALLPLAVHQKGRGHDEWIGKIALTTRLKDTLKAFVVGPSGSPSPLLYALAALCLLAGAGLLGARVAAADRRRLFVPLVVGASVVLVPLALKLVGADYLFYRNVIPAAVPLAIVLAAGYATGRLGVAAAVLLCATGVATVLAVNVDRNLQRADWRDAAKAVGATPTARAVVVPFIGDDPMELYLGHTARLKGPATVSEVDVLGWTNEGAAHSKAPAPGFKVAERRHVGRFTLLRFRSARPQKLAHTQLAHAKLGSEHGAVLLQAATR